MVTKPGHSKYERLLALLADPPETDACIAPPGKPMNKGYGYVRWQHVDTLAHVLACQVAFGPAPTPEHQAAHSCGRRFCVNPRHLRWATPAENQQDRVGHGTSNRGEGCGLSKLTWPQVRAIRRLLAAGVSVRSLAATFEISPQAVYKIKHQQRWKE